MNNEDLRKLRELGIDSDGRFRTLPEPMGMGYRSILETRDGVVIDGEFTIDELLLVATYLKGRDNK